MNEWYHIKNINNVDSPALVIYPGRVTENISTLKTMIDDVRRLRPHVKTHKTKEAALLMIRAGINKFKCATIAEAEMFLGAEDFEVEHLTYPNLTLKHGKRNGDLVEARFDGD